MQTVTTGPETPFAQAPVPTAATRTNPIVFFICSLPFRLPSSQ
jgi:hypothetical protein